MSLPNKLKILLKLSEIYNLNPLYKASSREINQGFKLEMNGKIVMMKGLNFLF